MKARVTVTLKTGVLDPQGKAIEGALASLGIAGVASVRQGKLFDIELADAEPGASEAALRAACERLLANAVIENYHVEIDEGSRAPAAVAPPAPAAAPEPAASDPTEIAARNADMPIEGHP